MFKVNGYYILRAYSIFLHGERGVQSIDCRGQGGFSEDRGSISGTTLGRHVTRGIDDGPENLIVRNVFLDTAQFAVYNKITSEDG